MAAKRHSVEHLRELAHLRPRTNIIGAVARVRNCLSQAIHRFYHENGFIWVSTPLITASDCEAPVKCSGYRRWTWKTCHALPMAR